MALAAKIHRSERGYERRPIDIASTLRDRDWTAIDVVIEDVSQTGFRIQQGPELALNEPITLGLPGMGTRAASVVRKTSGGYGCEFHNALGVAELAAVLAGMSSVPIPFPKIRPEAFAAPAMSPSLISYPRKVRMLGALALAAASWGVLVLLVQAVV